MRKINLSIVTIFIVVLVLSCESKLGQADKSKNPIVTVLSKTLYMANLEGLTYFGMNSEDSTAVTQAYIKMWINDQLLYEKAKQNISDEDEIETLVEEYKKSLIINTYQTRLLKERLSKRVSDNELLAFYEENKERFKLSENIVRGLYLKIPVQSSQLENFQKWYKQGTDVALENINKNKLQNAVGYENFYETWVSFNDVMDNIPEPIKDGTQFLKNNNTLEVRDSSFVYLLHIQEYKLIENEAPFEYIKENLKNALIEKKRDTYIKQLQVDLYNKALSNQEIKYYTK